MKLAWLTEYQEEIELALHEALKDHFTDIEPDSPEARLAAAVRYGVLNGGKRIRPILGLLAYESTTKNLSSADRQRAIKIMLAVEFLHCSSLIHDDLPLVDNDELRRGKPTVWKKYGEQIALFAGNTLVVMAFQQLAKHTPADRLPFLTTLFAEATGAFGLNGGQVRDLLLDDQNGMAQTLLTHQRKTAALLTASVESGAMIGRAPDTLHLLFRQYGQAIGLVFQIKDDLLDANTAPVTEAIAESGTEQKGVVYAVGVKKAEEQLSHFLDIAQASAVSLGSPRLEALALYIAHREK